jgi:hypothetical protein
MPLARPHNTLTGISSEVATSRQRLPTATVQRVMQRGQFGGSTWAFCHGSL